MHTVSRPALFFVAFTGLASVAPALPGCSSGRSSSTGGDAGSVAGAGSPGATSGAGGAAGANASGGAGTSGIGGSAGLATAGSAGSLPDAGVDAPASMDAPAAVACKGTWKPGGGTPTAMRTDVTLRPIVELPGDVTRLARDPISKDFFVLRQSGDVHRVAVQPGGAATTARAYTAAEIGLPAANEEALGMAFAPDGTLFISTHVTAKGSPSTSRATIWKGVPAAGTARTWTKLAETVPYPRSNTYFDHEWSGLAVSPDGKSLFVNCGSRTDHGEVQTAGGAYPGTREIALTARVLRLPLTGTSTLQIPNDEAQLAAKGWVFVTGTRNSYDLELAPNGDLLAGDNGPDGDYHEELNWLREGSHYGFPWRLGNEDNAMQAPSYDPATDKRLDPAYGATRMMFWHNDPAFPPKPSGVTLVDPLLNPGPDADEYRDPATGQVKRAAGSGKPFGTFSDHGSPLGLTFDPGNGDLCGEFSGAAFILRFGRAAGDFEVGRDLLYLGLSKRNGAYGLSAVRQLVTGFMAPIDAILLGDVMFVLDRATDTDTGNAILYAVTMPNGK